VHFERLDLLAFGPFTGERLTLGTGLNLLYGPNEAGKSTALRAITGLLYGIPQRTGDAHQHRMEDLRIGALLRHGGTALEVVRRKGLKDTLLTPAGQPLDREAERRFHALLGGVGEELFTTLFGLDHERLRAGAEALLEGRGEVGESLFGAGAGGRGIHAVLAGLDREAGELFKPTGRKPILNQALQAYKEAQKRIREDSLAANAWHQQRQALEDTRRELKEVEADRRRLAAEDNRLRRVSRALPLLATRRDAVAQRQALGEVVPLPQDAAETHTTARRDLDEADREAERLEREIDRLEKSRAALEVPPALLTLADDTVEALRDRLADHRRDARELPELEGEVAALRRALPGGEAAELEESPGEGALEEAVAEIERAVARARKLGDPEGDIERRRANLETLEGKTALRLQALGRWSGTAEGLARRELPATATVEAAQEARREHRDAVAALERRRRELADRQATLEGEFTALRAAGEVPTEAALEAARQLRDERWAALRAAVPTASAESWETLATTYEAAVESADTLADRLRREAHRTEALARLEGDRVRRTQDGEHLRAEAETLAQQAAALEAAWEAHWTPLDITPGSPPEMKEWLDAARAVVALVEQRGAEEAEIHRLEAQVAGQREAILAALAALPAQGPGTTATADASLAALLDRAQATARDAVATAHRRREAATRATRIATLRTHAETLETELHALLKRHLPDEPELLQRPFADAGAVLIERHQAARTAHAEGQRLDAERQRHERELEAVQERRGAAQGRLDALMTAAGVADEAALRDAERRSTEAATLETRQAEIEKQLLAHGEGLSLEALEAEAREEDPDTLPARRAEVERELEARQTREQQLRHDLGGQEKELEVLEAKEGAGAAAEAAEEHLATLQHTAQRYLRLRLASLVLRREIERYRETNQGPILQRANALFPRLTLGRYTRLQVGYGAGDQAVLRCILADEHGGGDKGVEELSDGTRDQLYLALRLASLERHAHHNDPIPLVLDDILIHFDDHRAQAALEILGEVANEFQILFFTHHARLLELARKAVPKDKLVEHAL
jgi:uncharacterized protein YhaN